MAQLKVKQISDFVSAVAAVHNGAIGTGTVTGISTAKSEAIAAAATDATSKANAAQGAAESYADGLAGNYDSKGAAAQALVDAKSYADQAELDAEAEAGRLDAIVLSSAKSYADVAEADANTEAGRLDAIVLSSAKSYADVAESDAVASAATYANGRETSILSTLRGEISGLAGTDKLEQTATFGTTTTFSVATEIDLDNDDILVFVNGLQITDYTTTDGENFTVSGLGYDLENSDDIIVIGVAE